MYPQIPESVKQCLPNGHEGFLWGLDLDLFSPIRFTSFFDYAKNWLTYEGTTPWFLAYSFIAILITSASAMP